MHGKALFVVIVKSKTKIKCMVQQTDCLIGVNSIHKGEENWFATQKELNVCPF